MQEIELEGPADIILLELKEWKDFYLRIYDLQSKKTKRQIDKEIIPDIDKKIKELEELLGGE